jgi:ribosomal protein S18 acetylase RimI-like enzyme
MIDALIALFTSKLTAGAGGAAGGLIVKSTWSKIKKRRELLKHPIEGNYYSTYEDESEGKRYMEKALITVTQSGLSFSGTTVTLHPESRKWSLEGNIKNRRFLCGSYNQLGFGVPSVGVFFLDSQLDQPHTFKGLWAGHDSQNRCVKSGEYIWQKLADLDLFTLAPKKIFTNYQKNMKYNAAIGLLNDCLGSGYIKQEHLEKYFEDSTGILRGACDEHGNLIGAALSRILSRDECKEFDKKIVECGVGTRLCNQPKVGMLQCIAVNKDSRKSGVASLLVMDAVKYLKKLKCTSAFTVSWIPSNGQPHSSGLLSAAGFEEVGTAEKYWADASCSDNFLCPSCGTPPCNCNAIFMMRRSLQ